MWVPRLCWDSFLLVDTFQIIIKWDGGGFFFVEIFCWCVGGGSCWWWLASLLSRASAAESAGKSFWNVSQDASCEFSVAFTCATLLLQFYIELVWTPHPHCGFIFPQPRVWIVWSGLWPVTHSLWLTGISGRFHRFRFPWKLIYNGCSRGPAQFSVSFHDCSLQDCFVF